MTIRSPRARGSRPAATAPRRGACGGVGGLAAALEAWFPAAARVLPWRTERSGYRALVSELMLQQTQVARVVGAFGRLVERFPDARSLARAEEREVLALWQGLGYYRRARLLHAAAKAVCERHGGEVPADAAALLALPGIGRYTAGAIASIAFGRREPIVDGNVLRVLSRVGNRRSRAGDPADERWAWERAEEFVRSARDPAVANEAIMELGATVCTPAAPRCGDCPAAGMCAARAAGTATAIPSPRRQAKRRTLHWHSLVDRGPGGVLLVERPDRGLWAGMLQPPTVEAAGPLDPAALALEWGTAVREAGSFVHVTSHREVEFRVFVRSGRRLPRIHGARRVPLAELPAVPLSNAAWRAFECAGLGVRTPPSAAPGRRARPARSGS